MMPTLAPAHPAFRPVLDPRVLLAILAAAAPSLLAYNLSPSPTVLNQALAIALWGCFVVAAAPRHVDGLQGGGPLLWALGLVGAAVCWAWGPGGLPTGLALSGLAMLLAAAVMVASGLGQHSRADATDTFAAFCIGWVAAGVLNTGIAVLQVFLPGWVDGDLIADSGIPGRAVGNLRQPNHLSSLLLWSAIAAVALVEAGRLGRRWGAALFAAMVLAVVLTASRTGMLSVVLLAIWGLTDRRLSRPARAMLLAAPLVYAAAWLGAAEWARLSQHTFGGAARLAEADLSGSRFGIWRNALEMIRQQPWTGVGFGEFNLAWTLTPFPGRPVALFDHTHNLPLHLAVELGLPLAAVVMLLLLASLWRAGRLAFRRVATPSPSLSAARRCAFMMVLMIGLHSLLEYPLWYAYFLLPAAWAWAFAVGEPGLRRLREGSLSRPTVAAGGALVVASALAVLDYLPVTQIFVTVEGGAPLAQRIERGQRSVLFAHHADYAAATTGLELVDDLKPFEQATHYLLDTRLMLAWSQALARHGEVEEARFVADRLREFRNPGAEEFFAACGVAAPAAASAPRFQCQPSRLSADWRLFVRP